MTPKITRLVEQMLKGEYVSLSRVISLVENESSQGPDYGATRIAIVSLDILAINEFIVDRIQNRLAPTGILLCWSHTHSGPIGYAGGRSPRRERAYIDSLVEIIVAAVQEAQSHLEPVRLEYSRGVADVGINRRQKMPDGHYEIGRNPGGPRDSSLQVVSIFSQGNTGGRIATLVNYACHGTVLGPDNLLVSADWIGAMRLDLETRLGGLVLFLQGAAANINPDMYWEDARAFEQVAAQGSRVAAAVFSALECGSEELSASPLEVEHGTAWLPTETAVTTSRPPRKYPKSLLSLARLPGFMAPFTALLLDKRYPWKSVIEPLGQIY